MLLAVGAAWRATIRQTAVLLAQQMSMSSKPSSSGSRRASAGGGGGGSKRSRRPEGAPPPAKRRPGGGGNKGGGSPVYREPEPGPLELPGGARLDYRTDLLPAEEAAELFQRLRAELPWEQRNVRVMGREVAQVGLAWGGARQQGL